MANTVLRNQLGMFGNPLLSSPGNNYTHHNTSHDVSVITGYSLN
jgi:hypothetical protein